MAEDVKQPGGEKAAAGHAGISVVGKGRQGRVARVHHQGGQIQKHPMPQAGSPPMGPGQVQLIRIDNFHVAGLEGDFFPAHLAHAAAPDAITEFKERMIMEIGDIPHFQGTGRDPIRDVGQEMERNLRIFQDGEFFG